MKKILSIILIISIISLAILPAKTWAWPNDSNALAIGLAVTTIAFSFLVTSAVKSNVEYAQKPEVWVFVERGKVTRNDPDWDVPILSVHKLKINEDMYVLSSPNGRDVIGAVKAGEIYVVEGETTNELGQWYKIKVASDHLSKQGH